MGIFDNIKQNIMQNQDKKIIEKIKKESDPRVIYDLIGELQLDDSRMQIFRLFDQNHVYASFKEKRYKEISCYIENPYIIFKQLQEDKNRLELIKYFYEYNINKKGFNVCIGANKDESKIILLEAIKSQEYREQVLDIMYNSMNFDYEYIEEVVLEIIDNMEPKKREQFLKSHSFNNKMTIELYSKYNDEELIKRADSSIKQYLTTLESTYEIIAMNQEQAKRILELYGDTMCSTNLGICIENSYYDNVDSLEKMLNKYYKRIKDKINSIFHGTTIWRYDYKNLEMFISNFSEDIDENTVKEILDNYNESLAQAKDRMMLETEGQNKMRSFVEHDREEPKFLYETVCKYYDTKMQSKKFKPTLINEIITSLPLADRLEFVKKYKDRIKTLEIRGIAKEVLSNFEYADIKKFLIEYQDVIPLQEIIEIVKAMPFKQRMELIKLSNLDEEQKNEIIKHAQENGEQNVSFLELAITKSKLQKNNLDTQTHPNNEFRDYENLRD